MNKIHLKLDINNCIDCPYCYKYFPEVHSMVNYRVYIHCTKVKEKNSYESKLIAQTDSWNYRELCEIPNWCPYLNK